MDLNKKIHWNIAGGFIKHEIIMDFFLKNNLINKYKCISVYDGIENCKWNGGRLHQYVPFSKKIKEKYEELGWSINLTFTNPNIDLMDPIGNKLLEEFHNEGKGIILINDSLRDHIRRNYPKYKLIHSITGCGCVQGFPLRDCDLNFYKEKQEKYDVIIPRSDSIFDSKLRQLDISRIELLISDTCILNCPFFGKHFEEIAKHNSSGKDASEDMKKRIGECWIQKDEFEKKIEMEKKVFGDKYPFYLSFEQIKSLIKEGFTTFKIQGRESSEKDFLQDLAKFLKDYNE